MSIEAFEKRGELLKLKSRLVQAENERLSRKETISFDEVAKRLGDKFDE